MEIQTFSSIDEEIDFRKTRIESLGMSTRTENALTGANIRTVGGIVRKTEASLLEIHGLGVRGIKEINDGLDFLASSLKEKFKNSPRISDSSLEIPEEFALSSQEKIIPIVKTKEELIDFYKTEIESLELSKRTKDILIKKYVEIFNETTTKEEPLVLDSGVVESNNNIEENKNTSNLYVSNTYIKKDIDTIVDFFVNYFDIDEELIKSSTRKKEITEVRNLIIYFLREYCNVSFVKAGRFFGRDHTTAIHSYWKVKNNTEYVQRIEKEFSPLITELESTWGEKKDIRKIVIKGDRTNKVEKNKKRHEPRYKEIPERNMRVFQLYKQGLTLEDIAKITKVTRERIRQIAEKVITQIVDNELIENGIVIDLNTVIQEEKENRKDIKIINRPIKPIKLVKPKTWSHNYLACKSCGTTTVPHFNKGLCENCGKASIYGDERESIIIEHGNKCDSCGIPREEARAKFGRDFYLSRLSKSVLCKRCHSTKTGKNLGNIRKNRWKMFYKS